MNTFATVPASQLDENQSKLVKTGNGWVLLTKVAGVIYAVTPVCPHANGDMTYGAVIDGTIECPLHGWRFRLHDGACVDPIGGANLRTYPVRIVDGVVH
jgi:3-phenylpropionate/trans-cinnamate dioxygenase ferredoxin component